jgi:beta-glucosidase
MAGVEPTHNSESPASENGNLGFPPGFLWGVSTASHQVEGNTDNQWSAWERAGKIKSGDASGLACDWWHNAERDFDLARQLGLNALRLSLEWSRIEPQPGQWDQRALDRYRQMLSGLHARGLRPLVCLHHFTHPVWLEQAGGFLSPTAAQRFEAFAARVVEALGDLCQTWLTFNEPNVYAGLGYVVGEFPPGRKRDLPAAVHVLARMGEAHARAYHAIHALQPSAQVGFAHNYLVLQSAGRIPLLDAWVASLQSRLFNDAFPHLLQHGQLPLPFGLLDARLPASLRGALDFIGLNVYSRMRVAFDPRYPGSLFGRDFVPKDAPQGDPCVEAPYGEAYPGAIAQAIRAAAGLKKPIYIVENGVPDASDRIRPWLLVNALRELHGALAEGHDVRGYFHWTLTDNFEWTQGWRLRFGLIELDPATQQRSLRPSATLYSNIVRANSVPRELLTRYSSPPL